MCYCGFPSDNVVFEGGVCGAGKGMLDIDGECQNCPLSSFRSGTDFERISCQTCHDATGDAHRTTTAVGSTTVDACVCNRGYFQGTTSTCEKCPANTFKSVASNDESLCQPCPEGLLSRAGSTEEAACSPPYSIGGYTAEANIYQPLLGLISHQTRVQDAWIDPRPHEQDNKKRCMFSDDGLTVDCPGESFTVFPRAVLPSSTDNEIRLTEFTSSDEIVGLSKFIGQGVDTRFRVAMNPSAGNQLIHDIFYDLEPLKDTPRYLSLPVRQSYGGPHFPGFYEQILSGSARFSPGAKLNYKLRLDAVNIDLTQTEVSLVTFITNKRLESQTDFQWIVCADTTNGLSICQENVPDPDDASKTMYRNAAVLDATVFRLSSTKSCYGDVFWLYNCEEEATESPLKNRFDDVFEWVPFGTTQPDLLPAATDFFLYTTFFVGQAAQCVDHGCIESDFYAQMPSHLSEALTSSSIAELRFLPGTEITIQTVPESLTYEDTYPTSAGLLAAEKYTHPIPLEGAMHVKYKSLDLTTQDQLCEFSSAGTGVLCRNQSMPNVFAKNMLTDGSLGKIEADFAAIMPVKICCDQEVDATCETELAVCHDGVDSQTSTHSLKEDVAILEDLNTGTAPYLDLLYACGGNNKDKCSCSSNQEAVQASEDRQVYERGSGVFSCAPKSCKKAKKWQITPAGDITALAQIGEIRLYQDADCTIEYDLTDVTKSTNIPAKSGYPFSYAFDGSLSTYFRPNSVFSAYEGKITFEFAHEVQVMCVQTTTSVGNYAHLPLGLGYAWHNHYATHRWSHGIVLEASCDGINWFAAAGPDLSSNNVVADKAPEDDSFCTDERGLQLKPGGALNFEIFNAVPDVEISTQTNLAFVQFVQRDMGGFPDEECNATKIQSSACRVSKESGLPDYVFVLTADVYRTFSVQGQDFKTHRSESYDVLMRLRQNSGETFLEEILSDHSVAGKRFFDSTNDGCGVTEPCLGAASGLIVTGETAPVVFLYKTKSTQHATSCDCKTRDTLSTTLLGSAPAALLDAKDLSACLATNTCGEVCPAGSCSLLEFDATTAAPLSSVVLTALHDKDNLVVSFSDDGTTYEHYSTVSLPDTRSNQRDGAFVYSVLSGDNVTKCDNIGSGCGYLTYADAQAFAENTLKVDWVASTTSQTCEQACVAAGGSCSENLLAQVDTKDEAIAVLVNSPLAGQIAGLTGGDSSPAPAWSFVSPNVEEIPSGDFLSEFGPPAPNNNQYKYSLATLDSNTLVLFRYGKHRFTVFHADTGVYYDLSAEYTGSMTNSVITCLAADNSILYLFDGTNKKILKLYLSYDESTSRWNSGTFQIKDIPADVSNIDSNFGRCIVSTNNAEEVWVRDDHEYYYKFTVQSTVSYESFYRSHGGTSNPRTFLIENDGLHFWEIRDHKRLVRFTMADINTKMTDYLVSNDLLYSGGSTNMGWYGNKIVIFHRSESIDHQIMVVDVVGAWAAQQGGNLASNADFTADVNYMQKYAVHIRASNNYYIQISSGSLVPGAFSLYGVEPVSKTVNRINLLQPPPPPVPYSNIIASCENDISLAYDSSLTMFYFNNCTQSAEEASYWRASSLSGSNQVVSNGGRQCHLSDSIEKICPCKITQTYDDTLVAKRLASSEEIQTRLASQPASDFVATRNTWAPAHEKDYVCVSLDGCESDGDTYKPGTLATKAYKPNTPPAGAHKKYRFVPGDTLSSDAKVFTVQLFSDSLCLDAIDLSTGVDIYSTAVSGINSQTAPQSMLVDINQPVAIPDGAKFQIEATFLTPVILGCVRAVGLGVQRDENGVNQHNGGVRVEYWDEAASKYKLHADAIPFSDETPLAAPGYVGNVIRSGVYNANSQLFSVDLPKHRYWKLAFQENTEASVFEANLCSTPGCTSEFNKKDAGLCPADPKTCYGTQLEDLSCGSTMKQELQTSAMIDELNLKFVEAGSEGCAKGSYLDQSTKTCVACSLRYTTPFLGATSQDQCVCRQNFYHDQEYAWVPEVLPYTEETTGTTTAWYGEGAAVEATFSTHIGAIAVHPTELKAAVADKGSGQVKMLDLVTQTSSVFLTPASAPLGLCFNADGSILYITTSGGGILQYVFETEATSELLPPTTVLYGETPFAGDLLACDVSGDGWIAFVQDTKIHEFEFSRDDKTDFHARYFKGHETGSGFGGVAYSKDNLYVFWSISGTYNAIKGITRSSNSKFWVTNTHSGTAFAAGTTEAGRLYQPGSLVMSADNAAMYVASPAGIMKLDFGAPYVKFANINSESYITIVAGPDGGTAEFGTVIDGVGAAARFSHANGLAVVRDSFLVVGEKDAKVIRRVSLGKSLEAPVWKLVNSCAPCPGEMATQGVGAQGIGECGCAKGSYFQKAFKYDSLTAWYKFETDAQDYGPNGVHLQPRLDATPSFSPDGHIIANDDISYLLPTPQTVIPTGTTTLTVSFWVKNWVDGHIMRWVPSNLYFLESSNDAAQFEAAVEASTLEHLLATNTAWSLMVAVFDTTGTTLFKDGIKLANSSTAKIPAEGFEQESGQDVGIFCNPESASSAHDFHGEFKDLRFYTAAFTAEEVQQLYQDSPRCVSCGTGLTTAGFGATSADECSLCSQGSYQGTKPPEVLEEGFTVVNADKDLAVGYTRHVAAQGLPYSGEFGYDADGIGKNAAYTDIEAVSWIPNTKKVLIPDNSKNKLKYMDLETYEVTTLATLTSQTHGSLRRACSADDKKFYIATSKGILEYDVDTDSISFIYTEGTSYGCAISQDGWLAFSRFQTVWELELANPTNVRSLGPGTDADAYGRTGKVYYMTYSPDDEYLVFTDNQWSQVRKVHRTTLVNSAIAGVQYSNSEQHADGKAFTSYFLYPKGLAFSRDGKYLYVAAWNSVKKIDYEGNPDSSSYVSTLTGQTSGTARDFSSYTGPPDQAKFADFKDLAILGDGYAIGIDRATKSIYQINLGDDFVVPPTLQYFTEQVCLACSTGITTASSGATSAGQCTVNEQGYSGIPDPVLPGLQAHYFKSDALSDATGGSNLIPSATYSGGYTFDNNYLEVTADTRLDAPPGEIYGNGQSDFSVSFWAADVPYDGNRHILRVHVSNVIIRTQMHNSNKVLFYFFKDANGNVCEAFFDLDLSGSEFTFVTVVKKGTDVTVYANAREGGSGNYAGKTTACTAALAPGDDATLLSHGDMQFFRGKIKDMRIFDRAISTDEIKSMFTASSNPLTKCPPLQTTEYQGAQTCGCDVGLYLPAPSIEPSVTYPNPDAYGYARTVAGVDGVKGNVDGDGSDPALTKLESPQHLATLPGTKDLVIMERNADNVKKLNMETNAVTTLFHFPDLEIRAVCTDPQGEFIFMVFSREIKKHDVANDVTTTLVSLEQLGADITDVRGCAVSKDGYLSTTLSSYIDGAFVRKLWEVEIENPTNVKVHDFEAVSNDLAYSPDDRYIYFGHTNHIAKLSRATSETVVVAGQPGVHGRVDGSLADSLVGSPYTIIFDSTGEYIYFSDFRAIRRIDLTVPTSDPNYVSTLFGSFDSSQNIDGAQPEFYYATGLALAPNEAYFYVSTDTKATVRRVSLGRDLVIGPPAPTCTACPAGMTSDFGSTSNLQCYTPRTVCSATQASVHPAVSSSDMGDVADAEAKYVVLTGPDAEYKVLFPESPPTTVDVLVISGNSYTYATELSVTGLYTVSAKKDASSFLQVGGVSVSSVGEGSTATTKAVVKDLFPTYTTGLTGFAQGRFIGAVLAFNPEVGEDTFASNLSPPYLNLGSRTFNIAENGGLTIIWKGKYTPGGGGYQSMFGFGAGGAGGSKTNTLRCGFLGNHDRHVCQLWDSSQVECRLQSDVLGQGTGQTKGVDFRFIVQYNWQTKVLSMNVNDAVFTITCTNSLPEILTTPNTLLGHAQSYGGACQLKGTVHGLYAYDRIISDEHAQEVLDAIVIGNTDNVQNMVIPQVILRYNTQACVKDSRAPLMHSTHAELLPKPNNVSFIRYDLGSVKNIETVNILLRGRGEKHGVQRQVSSWNTLKVKYSAVSDDFDQAYVCATYDSEQDDAVFHSAETNLLKKSCLVKAQYIFVSVQSGELSYDEIQIVPSKYQFGPTAKYTWSQNAANTNFITLWSNLSGTTSWIEAEGERKDPFFYSLDEHFNYEYFDGQNEFFSWPEGYLIGGLTWKQHLAAGDRKPMFPSTAAALQPLVATFPSKTAYFQVELPFANVISEILVQPGPRYPEWKSVWGYAWPGRVKVFTSFADDFDIGADSTAVLAHEGDIDYGTRDQRGIPRDDTFEVVFTHGPKRGRFVRMVFERCTESLCVNNPDEEIQFHEILQFRAGLKPCVHKCQGCCADGALIGADSFPSLNLESLSQGQTTTANLYLASATDCQHTNSDGQATMRPCPEGRECKTDAYTLEYANGRYQLSGTSNKTPTMQVRKGKPTAITFPSGHPLVISENSEWGAAALSQDVVTAGSVATITVPASSTKTVLYYYCSLHLGMGVGKIEILESDGARGTSACAIPAEQDFAAVQTEFSIGPVDTSTVFMRNFDATLPWMVVTDSMPNYNVNNGHLLQTDPALNQMSSAYVDETSAINTGVFLGIDTTRPQIKSGLEPLSRGHLQIVDKKTKTVSLSTKAGYMGPGGGTGFVQKITVNDGWDRVSVELEPHLALKSVWRDNDSNMYPEWTDSRNVKVASFITDKKLESDDDWKWIVCGEKSEQIRNFPTPSFVLDQLTLVGDSPPDSVMENSKTTYKSRDIFESQGGFIKNLPSFADINCDPSQVASTDCRSSYSSTTAALGYAKCDLSSDLSAQENCVFTVKNIIEHHFVNAFNRMKQENGVEVDKLTLPASSLTRGLIERTPVIATHLDTAPVLLNKGKATVCHTDLLGAQVDTGSGSTARFLPRRDYSIASNPPTGYDQKGSLAYGGFDGMPCSIDTGLADSAAEEAFLGEKSLQEVLDLFNDKQECVCGLIFTGFASNGTAVKQTFRVERTDVTEGDGHEHSYVTPLSAADAQAGHVLGRAYVQSDETIRVYESDPATNVYGATTKALPGEYKICQDGSDPDSNNGAMDKKNVHVLDGRVISLGKTPRPTYQPGVDGLVEGSYQNSVHWADDACSYMKPHLFVHSTIDDDLTWSLSLKSDAVFAPMGVIDDLDNTGVFQWMYDENDLDAHKNPSFDNVCEKDLLNHNLPKTVPCKWTPGYGEVHQKLTCADKNTWSNLRVACPNDNPTLFAGKNFGHKGRCSVLTNLGSGSMNCNEYCALQGKQCSYGWLSASRSACNNHGSNTVGCTHKWTWPGHYNNQRSIGCDCSGGDLPLATDEDIVEIEFDLNIKSGSGFIDKLYVPEKGWQYFLFFQHKDVSDKYYILHMPGNPGPAHSFTPGGMLIGGRGGVGMSAERCPVSDDYYNEKGVLSWKPSIDAPGTEFFLYHMFLFGESHACRHHACQDSKVYEDSAELSKIRNAKIDDSNPPLLIMQGSRFALSSLPKVPFSMQDNCLQIALAAPSFTDGQIVTKYYITKANALFAQDFGSFDECLGCSGGVCGLGKLPCKYFDTSTQKTYFTAKVYTAASETSELFTFWLANVADATSSDGITLEGFAVSAPGVPELSMATASWQTGDKLFTTENKACADGSSRRRALLSSLRQVHRKRPISSRKTIVNLARRMNAFRRLKLKEMRARDTMKLNVESMVLPQRSMRKLLTIGAGGSEMDKTTSNTNMQREVTSLDGNRVMADSVCGSLPGVCELMRVSLDIPDELYCSPESDIIEHVDNELSSLQAVTAGGFHFKTVSVYRAALLTKCFQSTVYSRRLLGVTSHTVATAYVSLHNALSTQSQQECSGDQHCVLSLNLEDTEIGKKGFSAVHIVTDQNGEQGVRVCFGGPECHHRMEIANHTQLSMLPVEVKSDAPSSWAIIAVVLAVVLFIALCFAAKRWYDGIPKYKEVSTVATNDFNEMGQPAYQQPLYPMYPDSYDQPPSTTPYSYLYVG